MKKIVSITIVLALALAFAIMLIPAENDIDASEACINCSSDSKDSSGKRINQCKQSSGDAKCKAAGCKRTGTSSCSTSANVNVIAP